MVDQDTAFRLYRRAQQFLDLNSDEAIDPNMWSDGELSEAEQLIAELAFAMNEAMPQVDADTDPASVALSSACSAQATRSPPCVRSTPTAGACWRSIGPPFRFMKMSEKSQPPLFEPSELALCAGASPAKTYQSPEIERALKASALAYGSKCGVSFAQVSLSSSSWRTPQACSISEWAEFSQTWPRSGMMLSGTAFQLPPLAPLTSETASGLLPTVVASDGASARTVTENTRSKSYRTSTGSWRYRSQDAESSNLMLTRSLALELEYLTGEKQGSLMLERRFVTNLMGFPTNWTQLALSETRLSRSSPRSSAARP